MESYSEVTIKCKENAYNMFKNIFINKELHVFPDGIYKDNDQYVLCWHCIKWDPAYIGVRALINVMNYLDKHGCEFKYGYRFIQIKTEDGGVVTKNNDKNITLQITCTEKRKKPVKSVYLPKRVRLFRALKMA